MVSNKIKFLFNNKIYKFENPDPNKTILNYVRNDLKKTGTKEGCAEGGCGACTIVLGELNKNKIIYKSINACISFLPILNGKQLILVEDLVHENKLHLVQDAGQISWISMWILYTRIYNVFVFYAQKS